MQAIFINAGERSVAAIEIENMHRTPLVGQIS